MEMHNKRALLTLVLPRGVVTATPLTVCLRPHKNAKESDPGHLGHLFYIFCGHFDENKTGGYPLRWCYGEPSKFEGRGWLPPQNILSRHFEKYLHVMVLKISGHVRYTISLLYKQKKPGEIPIFGSFLAKKLVFFFFFFQFWSSFTESPIFESGHV